MRNLRGSLCLLAVLSPLAIAACVADGGEPQGEEAVGVSQAYLDDNGGGGGNCIECYCDPFFCDNTGGGDTGGWGGGEGGEGGDPGEGEPPPPQNPYALAFYASGRSPNPADTCVQLHESADPYWSNNYLCSYANLGIRWSSAGPIAGLYCVQIREPAEPSYTTWNDNYLCGPSWVFGLNTTWSYAGRPLGGFHGCINFNDPQDPHTWADNWLCY
jgi:hypothetical protein